MLRKRPDHNRLNWFPGPVILLIRSEFQVLPCPNACGNMPKLNSSAYIPILRTVIELAGKRYLKLWPAVKIPSDGTTLPGSAIEFSSSGFAVKVV
jgi:hypothetical protein